MSSIDLTADRGSSLVAIYWVEGAVAILAVGMRMWGRVIIRKIGPDDYVMLFALLLFLILAGFATYYASIGGCKHLAALSPFEQGQAVKYNWITQPWGIFGFAVAKISVALLILRIIGPNTVWRKWILYGTMVSVFLINAIGCILTYVQCDPPRALWMPELIASGEAKCWDSKIQSHYAIFLSSWNVMIDVLLAVLPVTIFYKLKMARGKKIGLCVLLGLGLLAAICGAIKIKFLAGLTARSDLTWETYNLFAWSGAELFVIIVCGSIPPMKPIFDLLFTNKRRDRNGYSKNSAYPSSSPSYGSGASSKQRSSQKSTMVSNASDEIMLHESPRLPPSPRMPQRQRQQHPRGSSAMIAAGMSEKQQNMLPEDGIMKTTSVRMYGEAV